jgi:hypothetical protein
MAELGTNESNKNSDDSDYLLSDDGDDDQPVRKQPINKKGKNYIYYEEEDKYPITFIGDMSKGVEFMWIYAISQVVLQGILVLWAKEELIFPERVAPKFSFDIAITVILAPFLVFWQ